MFSLNQKEINNLKANFLLILLLTHFLTTNHSQKTTPQDHHFDTHPVPSLA